MSVAVLGAGIMGAGIAQVCAVAGHHVRLSDVSDERLEKGLSGVDVSLARMVKAGRLEESAAAEARARIQPVVGVAAAAQDVDVVVESVSEDLALKQEVLAEAASAAAADALLGTNTSQLSITAVAAPLGDAADRLVGLHFFNPPVMMRLVELVRGLQTSDLALEQARAFAVGLSKEVVVCQKDSPGFLTSRISAILRAEAIRMLDEGLASAEDIDKAIRLAFNHPMGPLELGDFNGLDTYLKALEGLHKAHGERFAPSVSLRNMVAAGRLGRKSGAGFYSYDNGSAGGS
jgi:3-hydroxybutyryl-CoA dehydrogenase